MSIDRNADALGLLAGFTRLTTFDPLFERLVAKPQAFQQSAQRLR